jgi:hypothetical protein
MRQSEEMAHDPEKLQTFRDKIMRQSERNRERWRFNPKA